MLEGTKLHEDNFAPKVNFARVTILHGWSFLDESKKKTEKNIYIKKQKKKLKDKLIKNKNKKLLTEGKSKGYEK